MVADRLGMSVKRAKMEIDSAEFSDWLAFYAVTHDPADKRAAAICAAITNAAGNRKSAVEAADFLAPLPTLPKPAMSCDEMVAVLKGATRAAPKPEMSADEMVKVFKAATQAAPSVVGIPTAQLEALAK
jgi:hypothetical protein